MPIKINNNEVENVRVNGEEVDIINVNGIEVWRRGPKTWVFENSSTFTSSSVSSSSRNTYTWASSSTSTVRWTLPSWDILHSYNFTVEIRHYNSGNGWSDWRTTSRRGTKAETTIFYDYGVSFTEASCSVSKGGTSYSRINTLIQLGATNTTNDYRTWGQIHITSGNTQTLYFRGGRQFSNSCNVNSVSSRTHYAQIRNIRLELEYE